jgi:hypothetical protein
VPTATRFAGGNELGQKREEEDRQLEVEQLISTAVRMTRQNDTGAAFWSTLMSDLSRSVYQAR